MSAVLRATGLNFAYEQTPVLHDIALELHTGQVMALIGPNGSGKSTLIKVLSGHLHGTGEVLVNGVPLQKWRRRMLARTIAYLPQTPTYEAADRVTDVLRLGRAPYWAAFGVETEHDLIAVQRVAALLQLEDLLTRRMDELSGGQRQRVFIGRCLVQEPTVLFLDEPNTYLDLRHQVDLLQLLHKLAHEHDLAVLMASHDLNLAGSFADTMLLMSDGHIRARGPAAEVLKPDLIGQAYGLPMMQLAPHTFLFPKL